MHTPQMVVRKEGSWAHYFPASTLITYGLGWFVDDYRGEIVVEHGGSIDGMRALVSMIPEKKMGLVVLTNRGGQLLPEVVRYRVYDTLLGLPPEDWSDEMLAETTQGARRRAQGAREGEGGARLRHQAVPHAGGVRRRLPASRLRRRDHRDGERGARATAR